MSNDIAELRTHLFDTLRGLKDGSMTLETAQAINGTAQTLINTAKVEVEHIKVAGGCSEFIGSAESPVAGKSITVQTPGGTKTVTQLPGGTVTQHRMG